MIYDNRFIAVDTETGGLPNKNSLATIDVALTEIAVVSIDNRSLEIKQEDSWLIKPYDDDNDCIYDPRAAAVSGISKELCQKEGLDIETVYQNFVKFLKSNKSRSLKPILVMQNKVFDTPFLENMFAIFNDNLHQYIDRIEDTLHWGRLRHIEKPNFKLGSLAEYEGIVLTEAHRALPDTITTAKIWISYIKRLRSLGVASETKEKEVAFRENFKF